MTPDTGLTRDFGGTGGKPMTFRCDVVNALDRSNARRDGPGIFAGPAQRIWARAGAGRQIRIDDALQSV